MIKLKIKKGPPRLSRRLLPGELLDVVRFNSKGLVPTVVQDAASRQVLTLCYLNQEALERSLAAGTVHLFRRSQSRLMQKGETSGHIQVIKEVAVDCEGKSLLFLVDQHVAACHAGYFTCYYRRLSPAGKLRAIGHRVFNPDKVYKK